MRCDVAGRVFLLVLLCILVVAGCVAPEEGSGDGAYDAEKDREERLEEEAGLHCSERNPPRAFPLEQRVDSRDAIECPGHYVVLDPGSGASAAVPTWSAGDWWHYRGDVFDGLHGTTHCAEHRFDVDDATTRHEVGVHAVRLTSIECDGEAQQTRDRLYTHESLAWLRSGSYDGLVHHELVFPLADGKRWSYMDIGGIMDAHVLHVTGYEFDGEEMEVWRVRLEGTNTQGMEVAKTQWFSIDARNALRERFEIEGVQQYEWTLIDSVDGYGEAPGFLPLPLPLPHPAPSPAG